MVAGGEALHVRGHSRARQGGGAAGFRGSEAAAGLVSRLCSLLLLGSQALKDEKERAKRARREEA